MGADGQLRRDRALFLIVDSSEQSSEHAANFLQPLLQSLPLGTLELGKPFFAACQYLSELFGQSF